MYRRRANRGRNLKNNINTYTEYENEHNFTKYNLKYVYNNHSRSYSCH